MMSGDPGSADQPDRPNEQIDPELVREMMLEWANAPPEEDEGTWLGRFFGRIVERYEPPPPTTDEQGNPLPRLDVDDPPSVPDDPLLRVGYALLARLPEDWESATLQITGAADDVRTSVMVRVRGDFPSFNNLRFFTDLTEPCLALRQATYEPGKGAWHRAVISLYRDGTIHPSYNYVTPPFGAWGRREVDLVRRDHELYPRDPEQLPSWHPAR